MYFRVNLKMKKSTLCCFAWIVFIELNFTVVFLLISKIRDYQFSSKVGDGVMKTWDYQFTSKVGGDGGFKEMGWGDTSNGGSKLLLCSWLFLTKSHISLIRVSVE